MMYLPSFFAIACIVCCSEGHVLRGRAATDALSLESWGLAIGDWVAYQQAESEDRDFLLAQLDATESELLKLQHFVDAAGRSASVLAGLQISATPGAKNTSAPAKVAKNGTSPVAKEVVVAVAKKDVVPAAKAAAHSETKKDAADMDPAKLMASLGIPSMKLQGKAALAPMLAMLKGLYDDSKQRIAQQNTREEKSKKWFATKEIEHKKKMADIEGKFANHKLSEEFRTNETRDENRYFTYWSRVRERQHRQFHTNLKIQHAMMTKVKKMIDMYEKTLSGKASDQAQAQKQLRQVTGGMPEIVLLQDVERTIGQFCRESLADVREGRTELQQLAHEQ